MRASMHVQPCHTFTGLLGVSGECWDLNSNHPAYTLIALFTGSVLSVSLSLYLSFPPFLPLILLPLLPES